MLAEQRDGIEIIYLTGSIDQLTFTELSALLTRAVMEATPCLVLECTAVQYVGSAQLKELIDYSQFARSRGGNIHCVGLSPSIQRVAALVSQGDQITFFDDIPTAIKAYGDLPCANNSITESRLSDV